MACYTAAVLCFSYGPLEYLPWEGVFLAAVQIPLDIHWILTSSFGDERHADVMLIRRYMTHVLKTNKSATHYQILECLNYMSFTIM